MTEMPAFDPSKFKPAAAAPGSAGYVYPPGLERAVKVALAVQRPLLLRGAPGSGKTTLARTVAVALGADYYQEVVTSRTEARDLEWRFDAVTRLADAQTPGRQGRVATSSNYVEPRALWWAFDPVSARTRGGEADSTPPDPVATGSSPERGAVVLIDEIDKAEPEVANDLLEPLDVNSFTVDDLGGRRIERKRELFLVLTTNEERDLPQAFLRRCVPFVLPPPLDLLAPIATSHLGLAAGDADLTALLALFTQLTDDAKRDHVRGPSIAEFLDALRAVKRLSNDDPTEREALARLAMWKHAPEAQE